MLPSVFLTAVSAVLAQNGAALPQGAFPASRGFLDQKTPVLVRLGTARRERLGMAMYTVALYADVQVLKQRARPGFPSSDQVAALLREGELPVALIFNYDQGISAERRREFNQQALARCWSGSAFDPENPGYQAFASHFKDPISKGQTFQVWIRKGVIHLRTDAGPVDRVAYPDLCRAFLACYLTDTPLPGEGRTLRDELLQEMPRLFGQP